MCLLLKNREKTSTLSELDVDTFFFFPRKKGAFYVDAGMNFTPRRVLFAVYHVLTGVPGK